MSRNRNAITFAAIALLASGCKTIPASLARPADTLGIEPAYTMVQARAAQAPAAELPAGAEGLVRQALMKDLADGFRLAGPDGAGGPSALPGDRQGVSDRQIPMAGESDRQVPMAGESDRQVLMAASDRQVQLTGTPIQVIESRRFDGLWAYDLVEDATHFRKLHTTVQATRKDGLFAVPDDKIVRNFRATVERDLPAPAGIKGAKAMRVGVEVLADPAPVRGSFVIDRVYMPGQRDREIAQVQVSRELRFATPGIPALDGQALMVKRSFARFVPVPTGLTTTQARYLPLYFEDVPLSAEEEQVWPGGTVIQQETVVGDDLKGLAQRGTIIQADKDRTTFRFERIIDLASGHSVTKIRTLDGLVVVLVYAGNGVLVAGQVQGPDGKTIALVSGSAGKAKLAIVDGATRNLAL